MQTIESNRVSDRPWTLNFARVLLLVGAFLTGLFLSESFGDEGTDEKPAIQQPLAQLDR
jgi:hypothetical protein